jgi:hypothetical protein
MLKHFAFIAETRIIFELVSAEQMHNEATPAFERRGAQLAAWI